LEAKAWLRPSRPAARPTLRFTVSTFTVKLTAATTFDYGSSIEHPHRERLTAFG